MPTSPTPLITVVQTLARPAARDPIEKSATDYPVPLLLLVIELKKVAVKNKYCVICVLAENRMQTPTEHFSFKKYTSSSGMEAKKLFEGFKIYI